MRSSLAHHYGDVRANANDDITRDRKIAEMAAAYNNCFCAGAGMTVVNFFIKSSSLAM
jgi:hypothetical protein